jgi:hypothetical protein
MVLKLFRGFISTQQGALLQESLFVVIQSIAKFNEMQFQEDFCMSVSLPETPSPSPNNTKQAFERHCARRNQESVPLSLICML